MVYIYRLLIRFVFLGVRDLEKFPMYRFVAVVEQWVFFFQ